MFPSSIDLGTFLSCLGLKEGQDEDHKGSMQVRHLYGKETTSYTFFFFLEEREGGGCGGAEVEGQREYLAGSAPSLQLDMGWLDLTTWDLNLKTWAKIKTQMLNGLSHPVPPINYAFSRTRGMVWFLKLKDTDTKEMVY